MDFFTPRFSSLAIIRGSTRFGRRRAEDDQQLLLDVADELEDREAVQPRNQPEHDEDEDQAGQVERCPSACRATASEPTPYLPIVNAIAPNAPMGATRMM